jgi:hypothetical protein
VARLSLDALQPSMSLDPNRRKVARTWRSLQAAWERGGISGVVARIAASRLIPDRLVFVHDIDVLMLRQLNRAALRPLSGRYELAQADRSVLEELVACTDTPACEERRRAALARVFDYGASCLTVRDGGRVVAYVCWFSGSYLLTYDDYGPRTLPIALGEHAVYLGNCFIRPEYRMRGLFPHLLAACMALHAPGTRFFGHVDVGNDHSFSSHLRLGFEPLLTVTCLSVGARVRFFFQRPYGTHRRSLVGDEGPVCLSERDGVFRLEPSTTGGRAAQR